METEPIEEREAVLYDVANCLEEMGYSADEANRLLIEFRDRWMDPKCCKDMKIFWRTAEYVGHEGPRETARQIHYFQGLKLSLDINDYYDWREKHAREERRKWQS